MTAPTYCVATLHDFTKIPDDRLEACLKEFATFVRMMRGVEELGEAIRSATGLAESPLTCTTESFDWTDDGVERCDVRLTVETRTPSPDSEVTNG